MSISVIENQAPVTSFALQIIPPLKSPQSLAALEAVMQSLVLDKHHPISLELAGTGEQRSFIVRSTSQGALDHIETQLRTFYTQLEVRVLRSARDPLRIDDHETVTAVELVSGAASYLPLRTWNEPEHKGSAHSSATDPLLGLLAALEKMPPRVRAVAQLSLSPAPADWSRDLLRKMVENPLEAEKRKHEFDAALVRHDNNDVIPQFIAIPIFVCVCTTMAVYYLFQQLFPAVGADIVARIAEGKFSTLGSGQIYLLIGFVVSVLLIIYGALFVVNFARNLVKPQPIYDPKLVAERVSRMAYRACLRLYVIGPDAHHGSEVLALLKSCLTVQQDSLRLVPQRLVGSWILAQKEQQLDKEQLQERQGVLLRMIAAYRQYHMASGAYFVIKKISQRRAKKLAYGKLANDPRWSKGLQASRHYVTVDAVAALWHLPAAEVLPELALVEQKRARTMLIPAELVQASTGITPIGYSVHGGYKLPYALTDQFFAVHTLITGKSGEGKSTIIEHIAQNAMLQGGLFLIDPHGDLCDNILQIVPAARADDVVLIDLADKDAVVGINPLDVTLGRGRDKAISDLLKTLSHIWSSSWGPRMENSFEMSLRTLFEANSILVANDPENGPQQQYTLLDILPLLTNENFCHALLQQIQDDYLHRWWREFFEPLNLMQQRDIINPIITKVAKFESILARRVIGQSVATLNLSQMIEERKIILLKLAKGIIGTDVAALLGATILGLLQITLEEQGNKDAISRVRFPIILDEFQVLAGINYGGLAELRKYGASFVLATQSLEYLKKLDELLLPTVLANVKQMVTFHMSSQDAYTLHEELGVEPEDILHLDSHTCYMKAAYGTRRMPTFSLQVAPPLKGDRLLVESIRARCRVRYTLSVDVVDERLRAAMLRSLRLAPVANGSQQRKDQKDKQRVHKNTTASHFTTTDDLLAASSLIAIQPPDPDVILLSAATTDTIIPPAEEEVEAPKKRRARGKRGGKRNKKRQVEENGSITVLALDDGIDDEDEEEDEEMLQKLAEKEYRQEGM